MKLIVFFFFCNPSLNTSVIAQGDYDDLTVALSDGSLRRRGGSVRILSPREQWVAEFFCNPVTKSPATLKSDDPCKEASDTIRLVFSLLEEKIIIRRPVTVNILYDVAVSNCCKWISI
jgi:hypothetical protein